MISFSLWYGVLKTTSDWQEIERCHTTEPGIDIMADSGLWSLPQDGGLEAMENLTNTLTSIAKSKHHVLHNYNCK